MEIVAAHPGRLLYETSLELLKAGGEADEVRKARVSPPQPGYLLMLKSSII